MTTTTIRRRRFAAEVRLAGPAAERVLRRSVPAVGREHDPVTGAWIVYNSRVESMIAALKAAGVEVHELDGGDR